jgi:hypothetical protein
MLTEVAVGSSFSLRSFARVGSAISVAQTMYFGSLQKLSVMFHTRVASCLSVRSTVRLGSRCSVVDSISFGSSLSLRAFARLSSSISIGGPTAYTRSSFAGTMSALGSACLGSSLSIRGTHSYLGSDECPGGSNKWWPVGHSVLDCAAVGSGLSVRSHVLLGSKLSISGQKLIGSSVSMRAFARLGSSMSVAGDKVFLSARLSVLDGRAAFGSTLSVRSVVRCGSRLSADAFRWSGSSLSVRAAVRLGSGLSVASANVRLGTSTLSLLSGGSVSSTLSVRSFVRVGQTPRLGLSVCNFVAFGSGISLRSYARVGSALSLTGVATVGSCLELSVIGDTQAGGTQLSVRANSFCGARVSVFDFCRFDSRLSLRSFAR